MTIEPEALQRTVDELEIRNLLARIHHTIDDLRRGTATAEDYESNWTDDCVWESPSMGVYHGRAGHEQRRREARELALQGGAHIPESSTERFGYHMTLTTEVRLDRDSAHCRSKFLYGSSEGTKGEVLQVGTYQDEVRRTPSGWRLHRRVVSP